MRKILLTSDENGVHPFFFANGVIRKNDIWGRFDEEDYAAQEFAREAQVLVCSPKQSGNGALRIALIISMLHAGFGAVMDAISFPVDGRDRLTLR